ncbi:RNA polymerase sigma-70 factor (ECF subfamily) [Oxalobacteraceae bacterium GrIS 1.18]
MANSNLHRQLEIMRPALLRFALLQLRNQELAEDSVQDTLLALLEKPDHFAGTSSLRTYAIGILKFKIIDGMRIAGRTVQIETDAGESEDDLIDRLFTANGHTIDPPRAWGNPEAILEQKQFFKVMEVCLAKLPAQTARVFMMREWLDLETDEICKELGLSSSNLWVILYRARLRLRECLDINWFAH